MAEQALDAAKPDAKVEPAQAKLSSADSSGAALRVPSQSNLKHQYSPSLSGFRSERPITPLVFKNFGSPGRTREALKPE